MSENKRVLAKIPELFLPLIGPHVEEVNKTISPGLTSLRWTSLNLRSFVNTAHKKLNEFELTIDTVQGIHDNRIQQTFQAMLDTPLVEIPQHDVITVESFMQKTEELCQSAAINLENKNLVVEKAVEELLSILVPNNPDLPDEPPEDRSEPGALTIARQIEQQTKLGKETILLQDYYQQRNITILIQLIRSALDALRKRVAFASSIAYTDFSPKEKKEHSPLFMTDIILTLPSLGMKPSLEEVQQAMNRVVQTILSVTKHIYCWGQPHSPTTCQPTQSDSSVSVRSKLKLESQTSTNIPRLKNYYHSVGENKEILKLVTALGSSLTSTKVIIQSSIDHFVRYEHLWSLDREEQVVKFTEGNPGVSDYQQEMHMFAQLETDIEHEPDTLNAGVICLSTEQLKMMLITEAKQWRVAYGRTMSQNYQALLEKTFESIEEWSKSLIRPLKDLDDVRSVMATLKEIRENEISIDMSLGPIEVRMFTKFVECVIVFC